MSGKLFWPLMGAGVVWCVIAMVRERIKRRKMIAHRPELDDDKIYGQFYGRSELPRNAVLGVWHEIANTLHVASGKIRPSDQLIQYKSRVFQLQSDLDDLDVWLRLLSRKSKLNPAKLDTIDDLVRFAVQCKAVV